MEVAIPTALAITGLVLGFRMILFGWRRVADEGLERYFSRQPGGWAMMAAGHGIAILGALLGAVSVIACLGAWFG
jgi:hypothetical protein